MRAKFRCQSVLELHYTTTGSTEAQKYAESILLYAVTWQGGNPENKTFWKATPSGQLTMHIDNPNAWGQIQDGREYYLTIEAAE